MKRLGLSVGYETDMIKNLGAGYFQGTTDLSIPDEFLERFDGADLYSGGCENLHFRLFGSIPLNKFNNVNLNAAFVGIFNRADYLSYYDQESDSFYSFGSTTNEVALEIGVDKRFSIGNILFLDLGMGNNLGLGFGGRSHFTANESYTFENLENRSIADMATAQDFSSFTIESAISQDHGNNLSSINARLFGKLGVGIIFFNRLEVGAAVRYGKGLRSYSGGYTTTTNYTSLEFNSAFRF